MRNSIDLFKEVKKYDVRTRQSRAPLLTEYIGRIMECVEEELLKVDSISLYITARFSLIDVESSVGTTGNGSKSRIGYQGEQYYCDTF